MAGWLQRWNFIERAKLERELWEAFERGEALEPLVEQCEPGFRREVWTTTLQRITLVSTDKDYLIPFTCISPMTYGYAGMQYVSVA